MPILRVAQDDKPSRPILADGAMGTELLARTGFTGLPAALNLDSPGLVLALHRDYVEAGARLLVTNTLGATPEQAEAGVQMARQACHLEEPKARTNLARRPSPREAGKIPRFAQNDIQIGASLAAAPAPSEALLRALTAADFVFVETVTALAPLVATVQAIREVTDKPIWATFSFDADGRLEDLSPAAVARHAQGLGLAAFGYGCGFGLEAARAVLVKVRQAAPDATLVAKPNLGLPRDGRYAVTPDETANWARHMAELGIDAIGLCCGSTPAHVRAIANMLRFDC